MSTKRRVCQAFPERHSEIGSVGLDPKVVRSIAEQVVRPYVGSVQSCNRCRRR